MTFTNLIMLIVLSFILGGLVWGFIKIARHREKIDEIFKKCLK